PRPGALGQRGRPRDPGDVGLSRAGGAHPRRTQGKRLGAAGPGGDGLGTRVTRTPGSGANPRLPAQPEAGPAPGHTPPPGRPVRPVGAREAQPWGQLGEAHRGRELGYSADDELVAVLDRHRAEWVARSPGMPKPTLPPTGATVSVSRGSMLPEPALAAELSR